MVGMQSTESEHGRAEGGAYSGGKMRNRGHDMQRHCIAIIHWLDSVCSIR